MSQNYAGNHSGNWSSYGGGGRGNHPSFRNSGQKPFSQHRGGGPRRNFGGNRSQGGYRGDRKAGKEHRRNKQLRHIAEKSAAEDEYYRQCIIRCEQSAAHHPPPRQTIPEHQLFSKQRSGADGINFDAYDKIDVERSGHNVADIPAMKAFADLSQKFPAFLSRNVEKMGYVKPTPIQAHAVPIALEGRDLMCCAQTGSGKTAAFLIPMIASLRALFSGPEKQNHQRPQQRQGHQHGKTTRDLRSREEQFVDRFQVAPAALVLAPTRELAVQIELEAQKLCNRSGLWPACVFGGVKATQQLAELALGADIIVATPGRLQDFVDRRLVSLERIRFLVLDEADRMLDMGFEPQIRRLVEGSNMPPCPGQDQDRNPAAGIFRQTLMFSATFPQAMQELAGHFLAPDYVWIGVGRVGSTVSEIEQRIVLATANKHDKLALLWEALTARPGKRTIVFCRRKTIANWITRQLRRGERPVRAQEIHGDRTQAQRLEALENFRSGQCTVLVATDVAARGLDVQGVEHVINFDLATTDDEFDSYVHRIGRTGRLGRTGLSTSFYVPGMEPSLGECGRIVKKLLHLLEESGQVVPDWFRELPELRGKPGQKSHSHPQQRDHRAGQQRIRSQHQPQRQQHGQPHRNQNNFKGGHPGHHHQHHQRHPQHHHHHQQQQQQQQQQYFAPPHHNPNRRYHHQNHPPQGHYVQPYPQHPVHFHEAGHHPQHRGGPRHHHRNNPPPSGYYVPNNHHHHHHHHQHHPQHGNHAGQPQQQQQQAYGAPLIRVQVPVVRVAIPHHEETE